MLIADAAVPTYGDHMKITMSRIAPLLLVAGVVACSESAEFTSTAPETPSFHRGGRRVELHVRGAGAIDLTSANAGLADFQFVARMKEDGPVKGHFRQRRTSTLGTVDFTGEVTCVSVDPLFPGRARIGGRITANNSTHPGFLTTNHEVGDDVWFRVQDGDGAEDGLDRSTTLGFAPTLVLTSEAYCALPFTGLPAWNPASTFPLARGSIRVKP
jgi:hypothetical protein